MKINYVHTSIMKDLYFINISPLTCEVLSFFIVCLQLRIAEKFKGFVA